MVENEQLFNQKLIEIGGGDITEGISIRGKNKEKILDFINANSNYEYKIDEKNSLIKNSNELKDNSNLDINAKTFLDLEFEECEKSGKKILITVSADNMLKDIEVYKNQDKRIIVLNKNSYIVDNRFVEVCDFNDENIKIKKDLLYNEELTDRLVKSLHDIRVIQTRSSTETIGIMAQNQTVYHGPSLTQFATVGSVNSGEQVYILSQAFDFYHIQYIVTSTGKQKQGYVPKSSLKSYSGKSPEEEDYYGGYCYATTELDVRTCDDFDLTAPVGTLFKHEGCTMIFHYEFSKENKTYHVAYIEYSTSSGTKRGYVYNQYLVFPVDTCVAVMKEKANVYAGPNSNYASIGAVGNGEFVSIIAKESEDIYIEYNTNSGRKRGYIKYSQVTTYNRPTSFQDFYTNGIKSHIVDERCAVYGGPNSNYSELGAVRNEEVTCFKTNKNNVDEYTFEYTCIEYTVSSTGQRKRGYVLSSKVIEGNLPEENNPIENFNEKYNYFGTKIGYGKTQKGRDMYYYKCGFGPNKLFLIFAQHGWEDGTKSDGSYYHGDGNMLLKIAKNFMNRFADLTLNRIYEINKKWTIYLFPGINLDGIINGNTNDGFGRCFYNGIDSNRSWPGKFKILNNPRNKTGNTYLGAIEMKNLKDTLVKLRGNTISNILGPKTVLLDIHGWENSFLSNSTELANYYLSEMKNINSDFKYKDTTNSTSINGFLMTWANNEITKETSDTDMAGLGAITGLLEFPPTEDYSDSNILDNYGLRFFYGTIKLLESMSVYEEPDLTYFCNSLETLYNLATSYSEEKGSNISVTEKNHLVLQYLRHKEYNGLLWNTVAGLINSEFNAYVQKNAPNLLPEFMTIPIPDYKNIRVEHWSATLDSNIQSSILDSEANDLSGWAGDLLQLGSKLEEYGSEASESDIYNLIGGTDDGLAIKLGAPSIKDMGFNYDDWVSDIDAVCISLEAKKDIPIYQAVNDYYSNKNDKYLNRYNSFTNTILGGIVPNINTYLKELVSKYTETKTATSKLFAEKFNYNKIYSSQLTSQFVKKLLEMYNY